MQSGTEHERVVGDRRAHIARGDRDDPATGTIEHRAHLDPPRAQSFDVLEQVRARESGVDQVLHEHDVAAAELELHVLHDADAPGVRCVSRDREEVDEHLDPLHRTREIGEEHERALEDTDQHDAVGMVGLHRRTEAVHDGRELGAVENDA